MSRTTASPRDGHADLSSLAIQIDEVAMLHPELVEPSRHLDVPAAVLLDQIEPSILEPPEALQPVGALRETERRLGEVPEAQAESEHTVDLFEHVEGRHLREVGVAVGSKDLVVEALHVEPDDEVGGEKMDREPLHVLLEVGPILPAGRVEDDREGEAHVANPVPASHLLRAALRLDVEEEDLLP